MKRTPRRGEIFYVPWNTTSRSIVMWGIDQFSLFAWTTAYQAKSLVGQLCTWISLCRLYRYLSLRKARGALELKRVSYCPRTTFALCIKLSSNEKWFTNECRQISEVKVMNRWTVDNTVWSVKLLFKIIPAGIEVILVFIHTSNKTIWNLKNTFI